MKLKHLKKQVAHSNPLIELISQEGDIYVCRINNRELLTTNSADKPMVFHSIGEARSFLGQQISSQLKLVYPSAYDEMINL